MTQSMTTPFTDALTLKRQPETTRNTPVKKQRKHGPERNNDESPTPRNSSLIGISALPSNDFSGEDAGVIASALPSHPSNIRPLGNLYSTTGPSLKTHAGSFAPLPDELLVHVLEQLDSRALLRVGATCKALHAFARHDELWKTLVVASPLSSVKPGQRLEWYGSWRATYLSLPSDKQSRVNCNGLYSDTLYRPFHCANLPLESYVDPACFQSPIPKLSDLSADEFKDNWADRPFVLTDPVKSWKVFREWDWEVLKSRYGSKIFRCEAVDWPLDTYAQYMRDTSDESPLYLFDSQFVEKMSLKVGSAGDSVPSHPSEDSDYTPFRAFYPDLFTVLGNERPSHRWLIMGPSRSGSSFHTDPNGTSAWNAVIRGRKYWIMSPKPPPGVFVNEDESEVTSPSSIGEWLLEFHAEARRIPGVCEGICEEGEVLHVPGGWYHLVLNLPPRDGGNGDHIAITQNFVPEPRLPQVLKFLRDKPDQVSGFQFSDDSQEVAPKRDATSREAFSAFDLFKERLDRRYPGLANKALAEEKRSADSQKPKSNVWEEVIKEKEEAGGGFSFGFGLVEEEEESEIEPP